MKSEPRTEAERLADELDGLLHDGWADPIANLIRSAAALLRARRGAEPQTWQPIKTAPTGALLLFCSMTATEVRDWCFVDWQADGRLVLHPKHQPTHWMPLPAPPGASSAAHGAAPPQEQP